MAAAGGVRGSVVLEQAALLIAEGEEGETRFKKIATSFPEIPFPWLCWPFAPAGVWPCCSISLFARSIKFYFARHFGSFFREVVPNGGGDFDSTPLRHWALPGDICDGHPGEEEVAVGISE